MDSGAGSTGASPPSVIDSLQPASMKPNSIVDVNANVLALVHPMFEPPERSGSLGHHKRVPRGRSRFSNG